MSEQEATLGDLIAVAVRLKKHVLELVDARVNETVGSVEKKHLVRVAVLQMAIDACNPVPSDLVDRFINSVQLEEDLAKERQRPHHGQVQSPNLQAAFLNGAGGSTGQTPTPLGIDSKDMEQIKQNNPELYKQLEDVNRKVQQFSLGTAALVNAVKT
jgi:hypothetical protein